MKSEGRNPSRTHETSRWCFGLRHSDFFRASAFGFRIFYCLALKICFPSTSTTSTMPMMTASTGASFRLGREPGGTALAEHHHFADARAHAVHGHDGVHARPELRRVFVVHELRAQQQQLAPAHGRVFLGRDHRTFDFGEEHSLDTRFVMLAARMSVGSRTLSCGASRHRASQLRFTSSSAAPLPRPRADGR